MGISFIVTNARRGETIDLPLRSMGFVAPLLQTAREILLIARLHDCMIACKYMYRADPWHRKRKSGNVKPMLHCSRKSQP